jgi:predicted ATPase
VIEFSGELAALRAAYETYQGSWEGTFFQNWAELWTRPDPARFDQMQTFLQHFDQTNIWALLPFYMASAAELNGRYGDVATAAALLDRADELVRNTGGRWCEAEIMRLRARFCTRNSEQAVTLLRASLATAKEQDAKLWELRTATDLADMLRGQGNRAEACEVLRPVCEWFSEGKDMADYIAARALLARIEGRHSHTDECVC